MSANTQGPHMTAKALPEDKRAHRKVKRAPLRIRLTFDAGLAAYIRAQAKFLYGSERAAIIALVRSQIIADTGKDGLLQCMWPHLPPDIQRAWRHRIDDAGKLIRRT